MKRLWLAALVVLAGAWPAAAQISFISAGNSNTTSVTIGTHQAGDAICIMAYNGSNNTLPTTPADYQAFNYYGTGANNNAIRLGCKIAASGAEMSGTWTNAARMIALVYRGVAAADGGVGGATATGSTTVTWDHDNAIAQVVTDGTSWYVGCAGASAGEDLDVNIPAGLTLRAVETTATGEMACHDTATGVSGYTDTTTSAGTSGKWASLMFELRAAAVVVSSRRGTLVGVSP